MLEFRHMSLIKVLEELEIPVPQLVLGTYFFLDGEGKGGIDITEDGDH